MKPEDSCVPSSVALRCPQNYIVVVTSASLGVAQILGSCTYSAGDCTADAMNTITCLSNTVQCLTYATRRKLPQCNDRYADYIHIEYDCVPILMNDSAKEYNVCQEGTEITTDHGIIQSPGYPAQFQTTTFECFRTIHVPNNKAIRLWLSDLYIGSTSTNCAKDHVFVVDSVQIYQHCGLKRYAYPYLCSSRIIIQYFVTTKFSIYRGMGMYFEVVDRLPNDNCPSSNETVTPVPATTTTVKPIDPDTTTDTPTYVVIGISSPIRSFQLCKGQSHTIECPENYVVVVNTNIFGVTQSDQCEEHDASKHCVTTTSPTFMCRQKCRYFYSGNRRVPSCNNKLAAYQYVEYQCIPTKTELISPNASCSTAASKVPIVVNRRGRFQSYNYPSLEKMNCTYRLKTSVGYVMSVYALDISLNSYIPNCKSNTLTFVEDGNKEGSVFCEQRIHSLVYSSCSNELDMRYIVTDDRKLASSGVELYIESRLRPPDWACGNPLQTSTKPTIRTTKFTTPAATPLINATSMFAANEIEHDICHGSSLIDTCPSGYTFMIVGAFYGVKKRASNKCGFVEDDCTQEALLTITQCRHDLPSCYIAYSNKRRLAHCSDSYADYLHITSQCVPSRPAGTNTSLATFDICNTDDVIGNFNGVVTSPSFPNYKQTNSECARTILGIQDRVLKIWINEMAISSSVKSSSNHNSEEPDIVIHKHPEMNNLNDLEYMCPSIRDICVEDYLIINAPHVAYVYCGMRKLTIAPICASSVNIQYKTTSSPSAFYKGFKFYFEWIPRPLDIDCGGPITSPITPIIEPLPDWALNLELSPILSEHICLGASTTLRCPRESDYVLSIVESNYAVTGTGSCEIPSPSHCHQEASLDLICSPSCFVEYDIPKPLVQCGFRYADYINIDYECIPTRLPDNENPIDICGSTMTDTITINAGIIISPRYPTLNAARTCSKTIETLPNKLWMVYIVDLFLEGQNDQGKCSAASLTIYDGNDKIVLCGLRQPELTLISCSNKVEFNFISTHHALGYRGFKVYFKTIDVPVGWQCALNATPTTSITTPQPPTSTTLVPPSLLIAAYGGTTNGTRQYCQFPFIYQGNQQSNCLRIDPPSSPSGQSIRKPWCSLTSNFDVDRQWGFCELGVTDSTFYQICRSKTQKLQCPPDYVIDIVIADYAAKPNGDTSSNSCFYDNRDCFQSDASTVQNVCAGRTSCIVYHFARTLATCQNRPSAYLHIVYTCIPNKIPDISTYDMCNSTSLPQSDTRHGYLISPNFPNSQNNIDCTFNLRTLKPHQDIYLYILDMDLNNPNLIGKDCDKDRLIVSADNNIMEICGRSYTNFLLNTCHTSVSLQLIRKPDARGRGVKFYFDFRERPPHEPCPVLITTTPRPTTTTPSGLTPVTTNPPITDIPTPSSRMFRTLCYPDLSSLFGASNFQCASNYIMVIHRAFYGASNRCDYTFGDCTSEADIVYRICSGKQKCSVPFLSQVTLPECNGANAKYLFVEYQCLPAPTIVETSMDLCTGQIDHFGGTTGILKSPSYPSYAQTQCANVTLNGFDSTNLVLDMYLIDLSIGSPDPNTDECSNDYLLLSYQCYNRIYSQRLCGVRSTEFLFSTCSPTDKIFASHNLLSQNSESKRGFALLYHLVPYVGITTTTATSIKTTTTTTTTTSTAPPGPGPISTITQRSTTCILKTLRVECSMPGYVLVLHKVELGVSATGSCTYSADDCFEDRTYLYNTCGGKTSCSMFPPLIQIKTCNNSKSNYLYAEYQCIPTRPKLHLDICSSIKFPVEVDGGAIISSNYTPEYRNCKVQLSNVLLGSQLRKAFKIYILTLNLPMRPAARDQGAECSDNDPLIEIGDLEANVIRLCGNTHTRYLLQACSGTLEIRYKNLNMGTNVAKFKGFEIYVESSQSTACGPQIMPPPPTIVQPFNITKGVACGLSDGRESVHFSCTADYGLVFLQSYHFVTEQPDQCDTTKYKCHFPSEQPQAQCSSRQTCLYIHTVPLPSSLNSCNNIPADSTEFYYQCLPMRPPSQFSKVSFCYISETSADKGFIETPDFPNTYQQGKFNCSITITLPKNSDGKKYSIYLYIIELSLRDTSTTNSSSAVECLDSIKYSDGDTTHSLCGKIDQPVLEYYTNKQALTLQLSISQTLSSDEWNNWQGARLFYIIGDQSLPMSPAISTTSTTTKATRPTTSSIDQTDAPSNNKPNRGGLIAAIVVSILVVVGILIGFLYYRHRSLPDLPQVRYDSDIVTVNSSEADKAESRSSIPSVSLMGSAASTFTSPFYRKSATIGNQGTENETNLR